MANTKQSGPPGGFGPRGPGGPGGPGGGPRGGFQKPKNLKKTAMRLLGYLCQQPLLLLFVLLCLVVSTGSSLLGSYLLRPIINNFIYSGATDVEGLAFSLLGLLLIYLLGAVATYIQASTMVRLAQRGVNKLRRHLFDKLQTLPLTYFDQHTHGELMSRFTNDADNVQLALEQSVVSLFSSGLMFVGIVLIMLFTSPILFIVTAIILGITLTIFAKRGEISRKAYQEQQAKLGAVNGDIQEIIEGLKVVKAFNHEEEAKVAFREKNKAFCQAATKANYYSTSMMPISHNLMNVSYACTACFGGLLSIFSGFDLGGLVIYLNYSRQIGQPLNQISQQLTTILSAMAGAERIFDVMDTPGEVDEGQVTLVPVQKGQDGTLTLCDGEEHANTWAWRVPKEGNLALVPIATQEDGTLKEVATYQGMWGWKYQQNGEESLHQIRGAVRANPQEDCYYTELRGGVRFTDVDFSYVPDKPVLKKVTVYANPGEKIAFVGSTGAGKTTITNLINRFYEIQGGAITIDGIDVRMIKKDDLRTSLGSVLQDTHLFTGTIMDNIRYGNLEASDADCIAAAKSANAHSFIRRLPQGYQTEVSGDGGNLSQGQRQLLAIARAAVKDPPVMILDEATSSIDTRTEQHIERGMDALMEGRTVFVIAHRLSTVRNANCIVVIEGGEIEEKGNHAALLDHGGRYYQLYTGQFQLT